MASLGPFVPGVDEDNLLSSSSLGLRQPNRFRQPILVVVGSPVQQANDTRCGDRSLPGDRPRVPTPPNISTAITRPQRLIYACIQADPFATSVNKTVATKSRTHPAILPQVSTGLDSSAIGDPNHHLHSLPWPIEEPRPSRTGCSCRHQVIVLTLPLRGLPSCRRSHGDHPFRARSKDMKRPEAKLNARGGLLQQPIPHHQLTGS